MPAVQGMREEAVMEALQVPSIWIESQDAQTPKSQEVEREVALLSPFIQREVLRCGHGFAEDNPVVLPKQVNSDVLNLLLDYCRFHRAPGRSDKERKLFDEKFIRLDTRRLCELTSAADALDMKPLVDLTSRALARMIEGKSADEIRETFHLPDDLTEEEKLEPVKNATSDPRIRLLNRLYAKKRKELADKKAVEAAAQAKLGVGGAAFKDERPLEDLLSFIGTAPTNGKSKIKPKKKRAKKKSGGSQADSAPDSAGTDQSDSMPAEVANLVSQPSADLEGDMLSRNEAAHARSHLSIEDSSGDRQEANVEAPQEASRAASQGENPKSQNASQKAGSQASQGSGQEAHQGLQDLPLAPASQRSSQQSMLSDTEAQKLSTATAAALSEHGAIAHAGQTAPSSPVQDDCTKGHAEQSRTRATAAGSLSSTRPGEASQQAPIRQSGARDCHATGHVPTEEGRVREMDAASPRGYSRPVHSVQGYTSGLGPAWQGPDVVPYGALPLPGAHITTLTSLANFRPVQNGFSHAPSLSSTESGEDQDLDLAADLSGDEHVDDDSARQEANLHSANQAYDMAMAMLEDENPGPACNPQWSSNAHASHASFEDWAASTPHDTRPKAAANYHDAFSFKPEYYQQQRHSMQNGSPASSQSGIHSIWQSEQLSQEKHALPFNIQAAQQMLEEFLSRTGLDSHFELKTKPFQAGTDLQQKQSVTVQSVLPECGRFMKLQLS